MLRVDVMTLFEPMFSALTQHGITARALERQLVQLHYWNPRDHVQTQYKSVDDRAYGGGPGMVMMAPPLKACFDQALSNGAARPLIYLSPQGQPLTQAKVDQLASSSGFTLLCGRYEGIDERFLRNTVDQEICIGDFVVSGGELPAMMLLDAVIRRLPGALNDERSAQNDSFMNGLLDHPHYTRPEIVDGESIPEVLNSGHHEKIRQWRREQALVATAKKRPDLLLNASTNGLISKDEMLKINQLLKTVTHHKT
jgi:tRNA (guanine37-N1)-methyltransferase